MDLMTTYRVIQWATGSVGCQAIRAFAQNPAYELVGVYVTTPAKVGRDAGELAGIEPLGVRATNDVDALLALDADCVHYAPLHADVDDMCRILAAGKNIVTPVGFVYPWALEGPVATRLEAACVDGGVSLHGTGIHPGFSGDLLPLTFVRLCRRVDRVIVQEVADLSRHPSAPMMLAGLGFGRAPEECLADPSPIVKTMERIFYESISMVAAGLGVDLDDLTTVYEVAVATDELTIKTGKIPVGGVGGMRWVWTGWCRGEPLVEFRTFWKMGEHLEPDWGYDNLKYSLVIEGDPGIRCGFEPAGPIDESDPGMVGRIWTAMNAVNLIPAVCEAAPGIRTHLDLPFVTPVGLVPRARADVRQQ
jgi:2,4-diaminopentanoate dehydrogenase